MAGDKAVEGAKGEEEEEEEEASRWSAGDSKENRGMKVGGGCGRGGVEVEALP